MEIKYSKRIIAYVDILGWTHATAKIAPPFLFDALKPIISRAEFNSQAHREALIEELGDKVNPLMLEVQFGFFSDSLVMSVPVEFRGRIYDTISHLMVRLLLNGFSVRGGISSGDLYHLDQIVFGPALIDAYAMESKKAIYSRVLVDDKVLEMTGTGEDVGVIKDHLGDWVVDPFAWIAKPKDPKDMKGMLIQFFSPEKIIDVIKYKINSFEGEEAILEKWKYQAMLCAVSLKKYGTSTDDWVESLCGLAKS